MRIWNFHGSVVPSDRGPVARGRAAVRAHRLSVPRVVRWCDLTSRTVALLILVLAVVIEMDLTGGAAGVPVPDGGGFEAMPGSPTGGQAMTQVLAQVGVQQEMLIRLQAQMEQMNVEMQQNKVRLERAEEERLIALRLASQAQSSADLVDSKGVGQPFKFNGKPEQDFSEWDHKMKTFLRAKFGVEIEEVLSWSQRQRKVVMYTVDAGSTRTVSWRDKFEDPVDAEDKVTDVAKMVAGVYAYLVSFTTGEANKVIRNSGTDGLEAWRRIHNEYDPTSSMRRVVILGMVQNPPKCKSVDELGTCLEEWLARKRQYEEFTDSEGNQCKVSDDSLMAAMYRLMPESLEEAVMFKADEFPSFEDLFDRLSSFASTKHSLHLSKRELTGSSYGKKKNADPDAMDIGAFDHGAKGKGKGSKGKGVLTCHACGKPGHKASECRSKGNKGGSKGKPYARRMDNVQCWVCNGYGHYGRDCRSGGKGKGKGPGKGKKGDGKGKDGKKGGKSMNSVEIGDQQEPQGEDELGHLDLCPLSDSRDSGSDVKEEMVDDDDPDYMVNWGGQKWIKLNYDSGAVSTVVPVEMVEDEVTLERVGDFRVANGEKIPRYGRVKVKTEDEKGNKRCFRATVTHVHKPLGSAGEFSRTHDAMLWDTGGVLIPKENKIAKAMRSYYKALVEKYGDKGILPLVKEGNLFNIYLRKRGPVEELNALSDESDESAPRARSSGN